MPFQWLNPLAAEPSANQSIRVGVTRRRWVDGPTESHRQWSVNTCSGR